MDACVEISWRSSLAVSAVPAGQVQSAKDSLMDPRRLDSRVLRLHFTLAEQDAGDLLAALRTLDLPFEIAGPLITVHLRESMDAYRLGQEHGRRRIARGHGRKGATT
jgi:hypothetical protein